MSLRSRSAFHRPTAGLSRRNLLAGGVGLSAMFALAACSGGGPDAGSDALWDPRPRGAQLAAAASVQSSTVDSRGELVAAARLLGEQTTTEKLPRPASWGGYRVTPQRVEFWQGGHDRLHDRLVFLRDDQEGGGWIVQRLAP